MVWCLRAATSSTKSAVFYGVTPCISQKIQRFGGIHRLYLLGRTISQERNLYKCGALSSVYCPFWRYKWKRFSSETSASLRATRRYSSEDRIRRRNTYLYHIYWSGNKHEFGKWCSRWLKFRCADKRKLVGRWKGPAYLSSVRRGTVGSVLVRSRITDRLSWLKRFWNPPGKF
jgi:hypothetical protein